MYFLILFAFFTMEFSMKFFVIASEFYGGYTAHLLANVL